MLAVAHEAMMPPSSHVFTVDSAPWTQDECGQDSLQIDEENYGYDLKVSITCGSSVNVSKLLSMIAEVSGATDYVANPAYYNISDGKLNQTPDGDWIFSKLDSSDKIEVKFSGTPDMYEFILPTQAGIRTVKLTKDQVLSVFLASIVSDGSPVDIVVTPTLEPSPIVAEPVVVTPEVITPSSLFEPVATEDSSLVDVVVSQEPSNNDINRQSEAASISELLQFTRDMWKPDKVTNLNILDKMGLVFGLLLIATIGKWVKAAGDRNREEEAEEIAENHRNNRRIARESSRGRDVDDAVGYLETPAQRAASPIPPSSSNPSSRAPINQPPKDQLPLDITSDDNSQSDTVDYGELGIILPPSITPDQHRGIIDWVNRLFTQELNVQDEDPGVSPVGDLSFAWPIERSDKSDLPPTVSPNSNFLSVDDENRLNDSGISSFLSGLLGGDDEGKK